MQPKNAFLLYPAVFTFNHSIWKCQVSLSLFPYTDFIFFHHFKPLISFDLLFTHSCTPGLETEEHKNAVAHTLAATCIVFFRSDYSWIFTTNNFGWTVRELERWSTSWPICINSGAINSLPHPALAISGDATDWTVFGLIGHLNYDLMALWGKQADYDCDGALMNQKRVNGDTVVWLQGVSTTSWAKILKWMKPFPPTFSIRLSSTYSFPFLLPSNRGQWIYKNEPLTWLWKELSYPWNGPLWLNIKFIFQQNIVILSGNLNFNTTDANSIII